MYKNGNFWYLFTSWDNCCKGTSSTYNIRVGRSSSYVGIHRHWDVFADFEIRVTGPFVDKAGVALTSGGGTAVLATHDSVSVMANAVLAYV